MGNINIFCIIRVMINLYSGPWKDIIGTALREAVIAHGENFVVGRNNTGTYLGGRVLGTTGRKARLSPLKILVPTKI